MASSLSIISLIIITAILVLSVTIIVSTFLCLLIRYFIRRCSSAASSADDFAVAVTASSSARSFSSNRRVSPQIDDRERIDSLPLFTFASVTKRSRGGGEMNNADCAVCLSKFEPRDELRLLPICCHAFHAECVDTWLQSNQTKTCPLCRSIIFASEDEILSKVLAASALDSARNGSFRVEIKTPAAITTATSPHPTSVCRIARPLTPSAHSITSFMPSRRFQRLDDNLP